MRRLRWIDWVTILVAIYLVGETVYVWRIDPNSMYRIYTGMICAVACFLPMLLRRLRLITLPAPMILAVLLALFLHAYGVLFFRYDQVLRWDTVTHSVSSVTVACCVLLVILAINHYDVNVNLTPAWAAGLVFMVVMTMGAYWEVFETIMDIVMGTAMQYSLHDTARDLACDAGGGLLVAIVTYVYLRRNDGSALVASLELHPRLQEALISRRR